LRALHCPRTAAGHFLTFAFIICLLFASSPAFAAAQSTGVSADFLASAPPRTGQLATKTPTTDPGDGEAAGDPGLHGNIYTGVNVPFSVTFDDAVWNDVKAYDPEKGYEGFTINSDDSMGIIEALSVYEDLNDCINASFNGFRAVDGFSNIAEAPELDAPASVPDAEQLMFTLDITKKQGTEPYTGYLECRPLIKGSVVLRTELAAPDSVYDEAFATWQSLLDGINVDKAAASALETPTPKATPAGGDPDIQNVTGSTYTSPELGFSVSWPQTWEPIVAEYDSDDQGDVVWASDSYNETDFMLFSGSVEDEPSTVEQCLVDSEALYDTNPDMYANIQLMVDADGNPIREVTDTVASAMYSYQFEYKDGSTADQLDYLYCELDPTGQFILDFSFSTTPTLYANGAQDEIQAILDSVEFA
jgi:hypothetical protein